MPLVQSHQGVPAPIILTSYSACHDFFDMQSETGIFLAAHLVWVIVLAGRVPSRTPRYLLALLAAKPHGIRNITGTKIKTQEVMSGDNAPRPVVPVAKQRLTFKSYIIPRSEPCISELEPERESCLVALTCGIAS